MGRKPNAFKLPVESSMPENVNPSLGKSKPSPARQEEKGKTEPEQKSTSRRRKSGYYSPGLRRSQRKTPVPVTSNGDIETYVEDVIVSENENDRTDTQLERLEPCANQSEPSLKEKVDYILERLETLEKIIESVQAKLDENNDSGKTPPPASAVHGTYTGSQNKLEALREENWQLTLKLESARAKVEVLEKQSDVLVELLDKWKDVVAISNLSKSTDAAVHSSVQAIQNACAAYSGKRKRQTRKS
ncbi:uncharacterized protein LOC114759274 isoform X2 [Neltuma alba]|uniref:uncharacterized protein LOC114759274 isoform X2 n=1 Tax=Neltuma alba TaxID=207710 RepID=UPI0010A3B0E2|nr:uncharacterized protein LOC114759274 isoform X2 [Prosopis alba]